MIKQSRIMILVVVSLIILASCAPAPDAPEPPAGPEEETGLEQENPPETAVPTVVVAPETAEGGTMPMSLTSPAFNNGDAIPAAYSCDGEDQSPDLDWFGIPQGTLSMALIMDDPDAPVGTWVHWVLYNIPADMPGLQLGMTGVGQDGTNSWGSAGYGGPCPPGGTHRYFFKLYALDLFLDLDPGADKEALLQAMEGHILGQAELMGTYSR